MRKLTGSIIMMIVLFSMISCCQQEEAENQPQDSVPEESLIKTNRYLVKAEKEEIEKYIQRHDLEMEETGTGLRYFVYEQGTGPAVKEGDVVELLYNVRLITGDIVYSSAENGPLVFEVGHGGVESGLEEALLYLNQGDKAKLIIPSHLAYGLIGDENKIPPRSTLIYDIEIIKLK